MTKWEDLTPQEKALLMDVVDHLRKFREAREPLNNTTFTEGVSQGIEMAKNEIWRLTGHRPF